MAFMDACTPSQFVGGPNKQPVSPQSISDHCNNLKDHINELKRQHDDLNDRTRREFDEHFQWISVVATPTINALQNDRDQIIKAHNNLHQRVINADGRIADLEARVQQEAASMIYIKKKVKLTENLVKDIQKKIADITPRTVALETQVQQDAARSRALENRVHELEDKVNKLTHQNEQLVKANEAFRVIAKARQEEDTKNFAQLREEIAILKSGKIMIKRASQVDVNAYKS